MSDILSRIVERKRRENDRRRRFAHHYERPAPADAESRVQRCANTLRRRDVVRVIGEVKFRSPSAGTIHRRRSGDAARIAKQYEAGGAAAVSVLADGPGFGGSVLTVRRVAKATACPVLFKEFVIDPLQLDVAAAVGARLVLLIVRALPQHELTQLVRGAEKRGLAPVVEAANEDEVRRAIETGAAIIGVNARDLRTFQVDPKAAVRQLELIPDGRVAVYMSGVKNEESFRRASEGRADALLIGEGLMRANDPSAQLQAWLEAK